MDFLLKAMRKAMIDMANGPAPVHIPRFVYINSGPLGNISSRLPPSMAHIDSLICLRSTLSIYHIPHATKWTREQSAHIMEIGRSRDALVAR